MGDRFVLEIPSSPEYVGTARIFAGAVARQLGAEEGAIDDLKLAVSELCSAGAREGGGSIRVVLAPDGGRVTVDVEVPGGEEGSPEEATPDSFARSVGLEVVRSIYPDAERVDVEGDRSRIRFRFAADG